MKIVVTGSTGFAGGHVLTRLIALPTVTSIVVLSRRALSDAITSSKITNHILTDAEFRDYPPAVVESLKGAAGCVWTLGNVPKGTPEEIIASKKLVMDYAYSMLKTAISNPPSESGEPFRLAFTSGALIPEDPNSSLWYASAMRKARAEELLEFHKYAADHASKIDIVVCKPWFIRPVKEGWISIFTLLPSLAISVDVLAAALCDVAMTESKEKNLRNEDLKARGRIALEATP